MSVEAFVAETLKTQGVTLTGADLAAVTIWYTSYAAGRPTIEELLTITDEPAVTFDATGKARA